MAAVSPTMRDAVRALASGPAAAQLAPGWHGVEVFRTTAGETLRVQTLQALSRTGLARQLLHPSRFTLTQAGRRLAAAND